MISSLLFTLLALVFLILMMGINFYRRLFMDGRETYSRLELLSLADNVIDEIKLWYNKDKKSALLGAGIGFVIGIIYSMLGGLYGYFYESYLFLSCSGPAILYFFMPQIKDSLYNINAGLGKMTSYEVPFLLLFNITVLSQMISAYIAFHALNFAFILFNAFIILGLSLHYLYRYEEDQLQLNEPDFEEEEF